MRKVVATAQASFTKEYGTPEVHITGEAPNRRAVIVFPYQGGQDEVVVPPEEFDAFYTAWDSDDYLVGMLGAEAAEPVGDILNEIPAPEEPPAA